MTTATTAQDLWPVHFRPARGWVGDVIPFERDGRAWLFYLLEDREDARSGTGWALVSTRDFVDFHDHGVVLASGGPEADDFNCYTGSVVDDGRQLHLFYTGHNPQRTAPDGTTQLQLVMHATSTGSPETWTRRPEDTFAAPEGYDPADWRDPFVFRPTPGGPWRMLLAARRDGGPSRRRGVVAQLLSHDLETWTPTAPFWDPRRWVTQECPEVFEQAGWWYLVFSEFSESFCTRYRMSRSPDGPWTVPDHDTVDGRAFYAAKSVALGGRRFLVGWIATREDGTDDGPWQWAGTMAVLEATQRADGTLAFSVPSTIVDSFTEHADVTFEGAGDLPQGGLHLATADGYATMISDQVLPAQFSARVLLDVEPGTRECGVLLRTSADGDTGYVVRLEPQRRRLTFDRWPRRRTGPGQWEISGDQPQVIELERPCDLEPGPHLLELVVDHTTCVVSLDRATTLSTRIYDHPSGHLGLFAGEGAATFTEVVVRTRPVSRQGAGVVRDHP